MKRPTRAVKVESYRNDRVDYTPPSRSVFPRGVRVTNGGYKVEIEEAFLGGQQVLYVGIFQRGVDLAQLSMDIPANDLDQMIQALTAARDEAKQLGLPNLPTE